MRGIGAIAALAAASLGLDSLAKVQPLQRKVYGAENIRRAVTHAMKYRGIPGCSIAQLNRNTGRPHEHQREIARRLRQAERIAAKSA